VALLELLVRVTGVDQRLVRRALPFTAADVPVHRNSADPFLHYELKPGARYQGYFPAKRTYAVNIDEHGARHPTHPMAKAPGTFRVLAFGGSTLYGGAVSDGETIAAALERRLQAGRSEGSGPERFEVWNFGTSAYTLGQAAHLARQKLTSLSPDLILVQHHNQGRRTFLLPESGFIEDFPTAQLAADPHLYREYFYAPSFLPLAVHQAAMESSATYRSVAALVPSLRADRECDYCDRLSAAEARLLSQEAASLHVPIVYFAIPADRGRLGPDTIFPELPSEHYVDLYRPDRDPGFYEVHPPGSTLDDFAALLIDELRARRVLPTSVPASAPEP
jgi:hypothetical protein